MLAAGALVLAACQPSASASPQPSASPSPSAEPSAAATGSASAPPSQVACRLPITGEATIERAQITGVTVTEAADADAVLFSFAEGLPEYIVDVATPPFLADPSGLEMTVNGTSFVQVVMQGASRVDPDGVPTYSGASEFEPAYTVVQHVVQQGDFEAVASWIIGLSGEVCPTVTTTDNTLVLEFAR